MSSNIRYVAPFGELYTLYKDRFVRIAMSYVRDRMAAEDIVTDSYMAFWENRHELETANVSTIICKRQNCVSLRNMSCDGRPTTRNT